MPVTKGLLGDWKRCAWQEAYAQPLHYQERAGLQWRQHHGSEEPGSFGADEGQGGRGRRGMVEHPLEGRPQSRPSGSHFHLPPQGSGAGAAGPSLGAGPTGHGFTAEEIAAAQQDGMDLSLLPGVQMAAAQMRALMDNTARAARAEQASGYSLLSSADWDIAQDPSAARLMTPENLANVRKWAAILSSAGEGMDWPGHATAAGMQGQQQPPQQQQPGMPPLTRPAAAAQLHLWQPAQHREVLQIPEGSGWRPRRRMSEALSEPDEALGRLGAGASRGQGGLYGYPGDPALAGGGQNLWQASQTAAAAMEEIDARKRARYSPMPAFAAGEQANMQQQQSAPRYAPHEPALEQQVGHFEEGRAQGGAAQFLQVAAEMARREGFPQGPAAPAGLSLAALHAAVGGVPEQLQPLCAPADAPGEQPSRLGRIDSMPLLPSAVHRQGAFGGTGGRDLAATLSAEPLLTGLSPQWVAAQRIPGPPDASSDQGGALRDAPSPAISPPAAPTSSVRSWCCGPCHRCRCILREGAAHARISQRSGEPSGHRQSGHAVATSRLPEKARAKSSQLSMAPTSCSLTCVPLRRTQCRAGKCRFN